MKNALGKVQNLTLFNEQGVKIYEFEIDSDGFSEERTYDERGNKLTYKDSGGLLRERTYDDKDNVLTYKNSRGYFWEKTYDEKGNQLTYTTN